MKRVETEATTQSGLVEIPDSAREKPQAGVVLAQGPKVAIHGIRVGDTVFFPKHLDYAEINHEGEECVILRAEQCFLQGRED